MEVMVIPLSSAVRISMLFSSLFDVDCPIFCKYDASMFLMWSFYEGGHAFHLRAGMFGSPVGFLKAENIALMLSAELATSSSLVADSPSTFRDMVVKAGLGDGSWPLFLFWAGGLLPFLGFWTSFVFCLGFKVFG